MDHCETTSSQKDNIATLTKSTGALKKSDGDIVDMELFLLVSGIFRMELLQLPVQPRRFDQWTIAPRMSQSSHINSENNLVTVNELNGSRERWQHSKVQISRRFRYDGRIGRWG